MDKIWTSMDDMHQDAQDSTQAPMWAGDTTQEGVTFNQAHQDIGEFLSHQVLQLQLKFVTSITITIENFQKM